MSPTKYEFDEPWWEKDPKSGDVLSKIYSGPKDDPSKCEPRAFAVTADEVDRIIACVNALAGIPDPIAFIEAAKKYFGMHMQSSKNDPNATTEPEHLGSCYIDNPDLGERTGCSCGLWDTYHPLHPLIKGDQ